MSEGIQMIRQDQAVLVHRMGTRIAEMIEERGGDLDAVIARMAPNALVQMSGLLVLAMVQGDTPEHIMEWVLGFAE